MLRIKGYLIQSLKYERAYFKATQLSIQERIEASSSSTLNFCVIYNFSSALQTKT